MKKTRFLAAAAALLLTPALAVPAAAAEPALASPGAPFRIFPEKAPETVTLPTGDELKVPPLFWLRTCTQGPTGTVRTLDGDTQRVMLTASHCVNTISGLPPIKNEFSVPVNGTYPRIGERTASNDLKPSAIDLSDPMESIRTADWGIMRIDDNVSATNISNSRDYNGGSAGEPVALSGIKDYRTLQPGEVSADNFGQPICKDGSTTGRSCATQIGRTRNGVWSWGLNYQQGDSGGVNFDPRDNSIIGVTSMTLGPLGKAQPADRILEDAYGIPDGQVNEHFTLPDSSAPRAEFGITADEEKQMNQQLDELNPGFEPAVPRDELRKAVDSAQQDAAGLAQKASRGEFNPAEIDRAVSHHSEKIGYWGGAVLGEEIGKRLS